MAMVQNEKTKILLNKLIFIGSAVLSLFKLLMYDFYCNVLKTKLNAELIYMDTNSFIVQVDSKNLHKKLAEYMDLSGLAKIYPYEYDFDIPLEVKKEKQRCSRNV